MDCAAASGNTARVHPAIVVDGLVKRYGDRAALAGIGFEVRTGEIVGLLGPNGAGKTTTLSILATLRVADGGTAIVADHPLPRAAREARRTIGFVPQQVAVYPPLTARENLSFFARLQGLGGREARRATDEALALVALEGRADEPVHRFSGGMLRRLNLACGILHRPRVVLLDEPTVGVDPQSRERIFDAIARLAKNGAAVLYSTHYMEEAERLCGRVVLLDDGRVVAADSPLRLVSAARLAPRVRLRTAVSLRPDWLNDIGGARQIEADGREAIVEVDDTSVVSSVILAAARGGGELLELTVHQPNLADVFFRLTGRGLRDDGAVSR
jgi:ABC-2 type transport system ATP-binding protein